MSGPPDGLLAPDAPQGGPEGCIIRVLLAAVAVAALLVGATLWMNRGVDEKAERRLVDPNRIGLAGVCARAVGRLGRQMPEFEAMRVDNERPIARPSGPPPWEITCPVRLGDQHGQLNAALTCAGHPDVCLGSVGPLVLPGRHIRLRIAY
ncbi:MAG: hypothetical protein JSR45_17490 [Proteobacteria bacterium]|nr:hypothetical protein [Pseudomonadota bacterium]